MKKILLSLFLLCLILFPSITKAVTTTPEDIANLVNNPDLKINIPGLNFNEEIELVEETDGTYIYSTFFQQYVTAVYKYSVVAISILAVVIIIFAGVQWLTSGGSPDKIKAAQKRIGQAIMGIIIVACSYLILNTINPYLVNFQSFKVRYIIRDDLLEEESIPTNYDSSTAVTNDTYNTGYNNVKDFKQFKGAWATTKYGTGKACTIGKGSACGPTSLADILNFYGINVTPLDTMKYAVEVGARNCDDEQSSGTRGGVLMNKLSVSPWKDRVKGKMLINKKNSTTVGKIIKILTENKQPVMFGCDGCIVFDSRTPSKSNPETNCRNKNACITPKFYKAHFMVLTGYDSDKKIFYVNDPGFGNVGQTYMTYDEVLNYVSNFYIVTPIL